MKCFWPSLLTGAFLLTAATSGVAEAQGSMAAAKPHIDKAKAAAYRPGFDLTYLYETVCGPALSEKGPSQLPERRRGKEPPRIQSIQIQSVRPRASFLFSYKPTRIIGEREVR